MGAWWHTDSCSKDVRNVVVFVERGRVVDKKQSCLLATKNVTTRYRMWNPRRGLPGVFQQTYIASTGRMEDEHLK